MSLILTQMAGFGSRRASAAVTPTVSFAGATADASDLTTYTFSSHAIGTASATRYVVVGVSIRASDVTALSSSVTVGGVSATQLVAASNTSNNNCTVSLHIAAVASGTTADIVVTHNRSAIATGVGVWAVYDIDSTTATATNSTTSDSANNLDVNVGSINSVLCAVAVSAGSPTTTWTGMTEDYDQTLDAYKMFGASVLASSVETPRAITCDWIGTPTAPVAAVAVLR